MIDPRHIEVGPEVARAKGPTINRGGSEQSVATPWDFIAAVEAKFGKLEIDLACTRENCKAPVGIYYPEYDSLAPAMKWHNWAVTQTKWGGRGWLNPPYSNITPWAKKCAGETRLGAEILLLVPGSIGANWYWDHVEGIAQVYSVGRIKFVGHKDQYPKDLILAHYKPDHQPGPMQRWRWK